MKFTKKQIDRYSRQIILKKIGIIGQKKLLKSRVLIIGAGGLGSPIAIYLAALGIGNIGIIDKDIVETSNLSRQIIFSNDDVKKNKSSIAIDKLKKLNPDVQFKSFQKKLTRKNVNQIAKNFEPFIRLSEEEVREEFMDFNEKFVFKASDLGKGKHKIGAEVFSSWQKHDYTESGSIKNHSNEIEVTIN